MKFRFLIIFTLLLLVSYAFQSNYNGECVVCAAEEVKTDKIDDKNMAAAANATAANPVGPAKTNDTNAAAETKTPGVKAVSETKLTGVSATSETNVIGANSTNEAAVSRKPFSLYEFGAGKCAQCKQMKPIIEELQTELKGKVEVKPFDIQADAEMTEKFKIMLIPCQVFLDGDGKEVFRHEGFFSKEEILSKLKEIGARL